MRSSACVLCAKRKVRCDREEPCSNCVKRKQECFYADDQANERIKRLEALVQKLGGDLNQLKDIDLSATNTTSTLPDRSKTTPDSASASDAVILQEENESIYLETPIWRAWNGKYFGPVGSFKSGGVPADLIAKREESTVFQSIFAKPDLSFQVKHPDPDLASYLWSQFFYRIQPIMKTFFDWEIIDIQKNCTAGHVDFSSQQHAFIFALYGLTVQSLAEKECSRFGQSKANVLAEFQYICEQALISYNFLVAYDMLTVHTLVLYLYGLFSQGKTNGFWDAMGILLRKAERIGLHRDGSFLGLSPCETEQRRKLWWCIISLDLAAGAVSGATSMNLIAEWDTKLPLNIEDSDICSTSAKTPPERSGLTSMSHCHWRYWIIEQQRNHRAPDGKRMGMSWTVDRRVPIETRRAMIDALENGFNEKYLRFCDPIKSIDMTILIAARSVINFLRRATLCPGPAFKDAHDFTKEDQKALLKASVQMLEYDRAVFTTPHIEQFCWHTRYLFPWSAFVHVLVELRQEQDLAEVERYWRLIDLTYKHSPENSNMIDDRRKIYAARLTLDAWIHIQDMRKEKGLETKELPTYISLFEEHFSNNPSTIPNRQGIKRKRTTEHVQHLSTTDEETGLPTPWSEDQYLTSDLPITFEDIDWMFWSLPGGDDPFVGF